MSHVVLISVEIHDLNALKLACKALELEFRENQKTYKWFGRSVGNYKRPDGFSSSDLGRCEHAIGIKNNKDAYEIGVCNSKTGKGYGLLWDFWNGGYGLENEVGPGCNKLVHEYAKQVARKHAQSLASQGWTVSEADNEQGETVITLRRY